MKTKNFISTLCLMFITITAFGQLIEPNDYVKKLSYTEFETEFYSVDKSDLDNISLPDMAKMKERIYEREYDQFINKDQERTTIIKHISSQNIYEDWMEKPEILVVDKDAVSSYNFRGKPVNRIEHSPKYLKQADNIGTDLSPFFKEPTTEQLGELEKMGANIEHMRSGFTKITFKGIQKIYNVQLLYNETKNLNEKGEVMHSIKINYMELPGGELVIERRRESTVVELDNNIKAKHINNRLYSNYSYQDATYTDNQFEDHQVLGIESISNNSFINIRYNIFSDNNNMHVIIYNISGRIVRTETAENSGLNQISIQDLTPGIYIINIKSDGKTLNGKFIKL